VVDMGDDRDISQSLDLGHGGFVEAQKGRGL
jgi:hypothetical protein